MTVPCCRKLFTIIPKRGVFVKQDRFLPKKIGGERKKPPFFTGYRAFSTNGKKPGEDRVFLFAFLYGGGDASRTAAGIAAAVVVAAAAAAGRTRSETAAGESAAQEGVKDRSQVLQCINIIDGTQNAAVIAASETAGAVTAAAAQAAAVTAATAAAASAATAASTAAAAATASAAAAAASVASAAVIRGIISATLSAHLGPPLMIFIL